MIANSANHSLGLALHNLAVREKNIIGVAQVVVFLQVVLLIEIGNRLLLNDFVLARLLAVNGLVDDETDLVEQNAVSWHPVSLGQLHDITDNYLLDWNGRGCSISTSVDDDLLVVYLIIELQELLLFDPVAEGTEHAGEH